MPVRHELYPSVPRDLTIEELLCILNAQIKIPEIEAQARTRTHPPTKFRNVAEVSEVFAKLRGTLTGTQVRKPPRLRRIF